MVECLAMKSMNITPQQARSFCTCVFTMITINTIIIIIIIIERTA